MDLVDEALPCYLWYVPFDTPVSHTRRSVGANRRVTARAIPLARPSRTQGQFPYVVFMHPHTVALHLHEGLAAAVGLPPLDCVPTRAVHAESGQGSLAWIKRWPQEAQRQEQLVIVGVFHGLPCGRA